MAMNKDQAKGAVKNIGGKIQEEVGKLVGSKHQQTEGLKHQVAGKLQETAGDLKEAAKEIKKNK